MDAACGPSNPLQNLGKQLGRDTSNQRDRLQVNYERESFRNRPGQNQSQIQADPQFGPRSHQDFQWQQPGFRDQAFRPDVRQDAEWVSQFSQMSVDGRPSAHPETFGGQPQAATPWAQDFRDTTGAAPSQERSRTRFMDPSAASYMFSQPQMDGPFRQLPTRAMSTNMAFQQSPGSSSVAASAAQAMGQPSQTGQDDAFAKAFAEVEQRIQAVDDTLAPEKSERENGGEIDRGFVLPVSPAPLNVPLSQHDSQNMGPQGQDLRSAAQSVLHTVSETTASDPVADKFRKSNFFALMQQLGSGEAVVKDDNVVISEHTVNRTSERDFPEFVGPRTHEVHIRGPAYQASPEESVNINPRAGQQPLEDPLEYIERLKVENESRLPPNFPSPLEHAQKLGPVAINPADWEEHYEEAVWAGGHDEL